MFNKKLITILFLIAGISANIQTTTTGSGITDSIESTCPVVTVTVPNETTYTTTSTSISTTYVTECKVCTSYPTVIVTNDHSGAPTTENVVIIVTTHPEGDVYTTSKVGTNEEEPTAEGVLSETTIIPGMIGDYHTVQTITEGGIVTTVTNHVIIDTDSQGSTYAPSMESEAVVVAIPDRTIAGISTDIPENTTPVAPATDATQGTTAGGVSSDIPQVATANAANSIRTHSSIIITLVTILGVIVL